MPVELSAVSERARQLDRWLRAFLRITTTRTLEPHQLVDTVGRLGGVHVAMKGLNGHRTPAARRVLAAGAVPIGATSVPRTGHGYQTWGHTDRGPTRNPWRGDLSPGGSSAGAAAAVAAGIVDLACGGDGAGSVRIPAAWCATLGFKPTTGSAPGTDPTGLAVPGALARDPRLLRAWADCVLDTAPGTFGPARTAAWSDTLGFAGPHIDPEILALAQDAAVGLADRAGLVLTRPDLRLHDPGPDWTARRRGHPHAPEGAGNDAILAALFAGTDLLMTATTPGRPHGHDGPGTHLSVALTWAFNLTGHPAVSIPAGFTSDGCPVGLQLVTAPGHDDLLLRLLEEHVPPTPIAPPPRATEESW